MWWTRPRESVVGRGIYTAAVSDVFARLRLYMLALGLCIEVGLQRLLCIGGLRQRLCVHS